MQSRCFYKPAAALLAALVCAALVAAGATPTRGHESGGAADATPLARARRHLRGMESSIEPPAGGNITTKGLADVVNTFLTVAENLVTTGAPNLGEWATGKCNYGNFCGQGCPTPGTDPMPTPVDDLDEFCQTHDGCFGTDDPCEKCKCHAALIAGTQQVLKNADCYEDNWASGRCQDKAKVREAPTIALGISVQAIKDGCLAFAWGDDCLSSSSSSASSESSEPASSSSSSTQSYRYTYTLATSCDSGSGTDGAVQVKITDKDGAWYRTSELNNSGNDRETCAIDSYERDSEYKVLLNSDTTCEVYFEPKGLYPNWKVDYVEVARSSDSEETKSAKFCTSGTLSSEGWHTFYYCS